jgi:tRNA(Ile2) C34 agmatinyltransferase TiaS
MSDSLQRAQVFNLLRSLEDTNAVCPECGSNNTIDEL